LPYAYWLTPAVLAALAGKPVIWNAVGASTGWPHAPWHDELLRRALAASYFVGVRDAVSRDDLSALAPDADIRLLPDTAFGLSRLWPFAAESSEFKSWRTALGLKGRYIVVQASKVLRRHGATVEWLMTEMGGIDAVLLPICWCHDDRAEAFPPLKGRILPSREWLHPALISEIIARSAFVLASSLHASITALSYGVPAALAPRSADRKYGMLDAFDGIAAIDKRPDLSGLVRRGRQVEQQVVDCADRLDCYWDAVMNVVLHPPLRQRDVSRNLMLSWIARECGDQRHLGALRTWGIALRESLAGYFPDQRAAVRRRLSAMSARRDGLRGRSAR
jgi:lipopolysaccharide transport system ATP-binding protein